MLRQTLRGFLILSTLVLSLQPVAKGWADPSAPASPGALDASFAGFNFFGPTFVSLTQDMALQPDGKIVVLAAGANPNEFMLFRKGPDGRADPFNVSHVYLRFTDLPPAKALAVRGDGSMVVATDGFNLISLTAVGGRDTAFGDDGRVTDTTAGRTLHAMLLQPDGKIVTAGDALVGDDADFVITRYNVDGSRDNTFDGDGKVVVGFGGNDSATDLALMADGRLVVVGSKRGDGGFEDDDIAVALLRPDGTRDNSFDNDGKLSIGFGGDEYGRAVAVQADGRIVVLGFGSSTTRMARLMPNGSFDGSFNGSGKLSIPVDNLAELALLPDNRIMLVGTHTSPDGDDKIAVRRLNSNGTPDTTFDYDGTAWLDFYNDDRGTHLALQPDGRILVAGTSNGAVQLARLWPDGQFDSGGRQTHAIGTSSVFPPGSNEYASALVVQPDGKLLVAGELRNPSGTRSDAIVARFLPNGQVDTAFGSRGTAYAFAGRFNAARAIALQPDGKIVIAGHTGGAGLTDDFLIARFHPNGNPDTEFGDAYGAKRVHFGSGHDAAYALALTPEGKIVVAGSVFNGALNIWGVLRLTSAGQPDATFGPNLDGKAFVNFNGPNTAKAVVAQPDGKLIIGGDYNGDFFLQRLLDSGLPDPSFGINGGGYNFTDMGGNDSITALALASNGWLFAAGYTWRGGADDFALAQYTPNGLLATCPSGENCEHWPEGKRLVSLGGSDSAYALVLRGDNQLVAAGCSDYHMAAAQISTTDVDAAPLPFHAEFVGHFDCAFGVQFSNAAQDRIVLAGLQADGSDGNIALARFETTSLSTVPTPTPPPTPTAPPTPVPYRLFLPGVLR